MDIDQLFSTYESADPPYITQDYQQNKMLDMELKKPESSSKIIDLLDLPYQDKEQIKEGMPVEKPGRFASVFNSSYNPTFSSGLSKGSASLEQALDKQNITGTKRNCLIKLAKVESGMNQFAQSRNSSASGMFQMIDSTRKEVSSVSKKEFMNNLDEQVRAASRLYDKNLAYLQNNGLLQKAQQKGLSTDEAIALTWLHPTWIKNWLNGGGTGGSDANGTGILQYLKMYRNK